MHSEFRLLQQQTTQNIAMVVWVRQTIRYGKMYIFDCKLFFDPFIHLLTIFDYCIANIDNIDNTPINIYCNQKSLLECSR